VEQDAFRLTYDRVAGIATFLRRPDGGCCHGGDGTVHRAPFMARLPEIPIPAPPFPELPEGWVHDPAAREAGRVALRAWREAYRRWRAELPAGIVTTGPTERATASMGDLQWARLAPAARLAGARRRVGVSLLVVAGLLALNLATTPRFLWAALPAAGVLVGLARHLFTLWQDGVSIGAILSGGATPPSRGSTPAPGRPSVGVELSPNEAEALADGIARPVLRGAWGGLVREAYASRAAIRMILARVREDDRALLPDVVPAVEGLVDVVRVHAAVLHAVDWAVTHDGRPDALSAELRERRDQVAAQCEGVADALESLRGALVTLRTAL